MNKGLSMRSPQDAALKVTFGFIDNYCNTLEDDTVTPIELIENVYKTYCDAKGYTANTHKLRRLITKLDLPYFRYVTEAFAGAKTIYSAANNRIIVNRSLSAADMQDITDKMSLASGIGILPFLIRASDVYATETYFGYKAIKPLWKQYEYKGYAVDHFTLCIDGELILVCRNKQNDRILRFRIGL